MHLNNLRFAKFYKLLQMSQSALIFNNEHKKDCKGQKNQEDVTIATGETSQAITPFHYFNFFSFYH